jgi:hypothetical protein
VSAAPLRPGTSLLRGRNLLLGSCLCAGLALSRPSSGLDKQGSAHGGDVGGVASGFALSGAGMVGSSLYNPSYAARPDNSGLTLARYAGHLDLDLIGRTLSIPLDVNFFTDRQRSGLLRLSPSEFDVITGVTSTLPVGGMAVELGARVERDMPVDRGSYSQTYVDGRARILYQLSKWIPSVDKLLHGGDVSGYLTLGWFARNPTYAARPDNTGIAALRYAAHVETSFWRERFAIGLDATMFTDRQKPGVSGTLAPSELDATLDTSVSLGDWQVHLAYERDLPVDRGGLVQQLLYVLVSRSFSIDPSALRKAQPPPHLAGLPTPPGSPALD